MPRVTPAVMRSLDILELFVAHEQLTGAEIARLTGIPRASVHELVATLTERGYLRRDDDGASYRLGLSAFVLGNVYRDRLDLRASGLAVAREVAAGCGETVNVGVLDGVDVVYLAIVDSDRPVRLVSRHGGRLPAHCTAVGKVLLAALDDAELKSLLPAQLHRLTPASLTRRATLLQQLQQVRADGVAFESGESTPGVSCAAYGVVDDAGATVAAVSVSVPDERWQRCTPAHWAAIVRDGARSLSVELGARTL